jgi:hypothetical protein
VRLKQPGRKAVVSAALATLVIGVPALKASGYTDGVQEMVLFADHPLPTNVPQTPEQAELGKT